MVAAAVGVVVEEVKALDREAGRAMEVEVDAEVVVARAGVEVAEEEEVVAVVAEEEDLALALARVTVAGRVMALDLEEGKEKAPHENGGYRFFYITPFTIICVMK